jgi:hypothetical protein
LVAGPGKSLLTLGFSGNLDAIDPSTGKVTVRGATGLGDCSTPASPCGPNSANVIGYFEGKYYATDYAQNLFAVDPASGSAKLVGPTGIPPLTFAPFSENPDGSFNVYDESIFSVRGKLYINFGTVAVNFESGTFRAMIPNSIYEIDRKTGASRFVASIDPNINTIVVASDTVYGFNAWAGQVVTIDLATGQSIPVSDVSAAAGVIGGATLANGASALDRDREDK